MKSNFSNTKQHIGLELYLANLYVYRVSRKFVCAYFLIIFWFIVSIPFRSRREDKGTSINDVRHFLRFFDPPSPQIRFCPISAHAPILWCPFLTLRPPPLLMTLYIYNVFYRCSKNLPFFFHFWQKNIIFKIEYKDCQKKFCG